MNRRVRTRHPHSSRKNDPAGGTEQSVIICPTPEGGHIEHAADVAIALFEETAVRPILVTRPGAKNYLPADIQMYASIREVLPPLSPNKGLMKAVHLAVSLVREHFKIRKIFRNLGSDGGLLILEEPRYPYPSLLARSARVKSALIMHNAISHSLKRSGAERIKSLIAVGCLRNVDSVVVHGQQQLSIVRSQTSAPVTSSPLPITSRLPDLMESVSNPAAIDELPTFRNVYVCVGEIRENKGIETAILAAVNTDISLVIAGKAVDSAYLARLQKLSEGLENVTFVDRFLDVAEFNLLIENAHCILLPYSHFNAQSGVLAKAISANRPVIATRLPALEEQAHGYARIRFFTADDVGQLNTLLEDGVPVSNRMAMGQEPGGDEGTWSDLACALLTAVER